MSSTPAANDDEEEFGKRGTGREAGVGDNIM